MDDVIFSGVAVKVKLVLHRGRILDETHPGLVWPNIIAIDSVFYKLENGPKVSWIDTARPIEYKHQVQSFRLLAS